MMTQQALNSNLLYLLDRVNDIEHAGQILEHARLELLDLESLDNLDDVYRLTDAYDIRIKRLLKVLEENLKRLLNATKPDINITVKNHCSESSNSVP